jgi:hypothetical protein
LNRAGGGDPEDQTRLIKMNEDCGGEIGNHENHPSTAKLHAFSNHRAAVHNMREADEVDADRAKRS